jgi:hypothetical protein
MASILDLYSAILDLAGEYPKLTGTISLGAVLTVLTAVWAYWKRPIINVRFGKKALPRTRNGRRQERARRSLSAPGQVFSRAYQEYRTNDD